MALAPPNRSAVTFTAAQRRRWNIGLRHCSALAALTLVAVMWGALGASSAVAQPGRTGAAGSAFIYWTNSPTAASTWSIGRASIDGSDVDAGFVTVHAPPSAVAADTQHIYWSGFYGTIGRANTDGSGINERFLPVQGDGNQALGMAVDDVYLYWADYDGIGRANLDGSNANQSFISLPIASGESPSGLAVDGRYIYWTEPQNGTIARANLDGGDVDHSFVTGVGDAQGVAVDGQHLYWYDAVAGTIGRANLDGSDRDMSLITGPQSPDCDQLGISACGWLAAGGGYLYWPNFDAGTIGRANVDGSDVNQSFIAGAGQPAGVTLTLPNQPECMRTAFPPSPPPGGSVFARPLDPTSTDPNVVVLPAGSEWTQTSPCWSAQGAARVMTNPTTIAVSPGQAIVLHDANAGLTSLWGAKDVAAGDPAPVLFPGRTGWTTTDATVQSQSSFWHEFQSCRACALPSTTLSAAPSPATSDTAYQGDLSGADLTGATLTGNFYGFTLAGANLTGANLSAADLSGADLAGVVLGDAVLNGTKLPLELVPALRDAPTNGPKVDLTGAQFVVGFGDVNLLAGADLSGIDLAGASFIGLPVDFERTNFDGASLARTSFRLADLAGATFSNVTAPGAVFADANLAGATFAGPKSSLPGANFVRAKLSGASFQSADISRAAFDGALAANTDFNSVVAAGAVFSGAHIHGDGQAFDGARDLSGADFSGAVLAGDVGVGGGFDLTNVNLSGAKFDGTQCVACNFTGSTLANVVFSRAYLPGAVFSGAQNFTGVDMTGAWLYCGDLQNSSCAPDPSPGRWDWPLALGVGETFGPVPFASTDLTGVSLQDVIACPDGLPPSGAGGCAGHLLPAASNAPAIPAACSAAGHDACPTRTTTLLHVSPGSPLAVTAASPATWATTLTQPGYDVALDDGTIRLIGAGPAQVLAGQPGRHCPAPSAACGDGGPASAALLGAPTGLAVGLQGSLYVADPALHRLRVIAPAAQAARAARAARACRTARASRVAKGCRRRGLRALVAGGQISTVAGSGVGCASTAPGSCGEGGPATKAALAGPYGVWTSPDGDVFIADGRRGIRQVHPNGTITTVGPPPGAYDVRAVTGDGQGDLYATTHDPDYLIEVDLASGQTTVVVGTGTSGYNGNTDPDYGTLLAGNQVQVNDPQGVSVALNGNVVFADAGNDLIRAYVPSSGHVIDDLGGVIANGVPQGGDNGDGQYAQQTELSRPAGVAVTTGPLLIVADAGNQKVRQLGPGPASTGRLGARPALGLARLSCTRTNRHTRGIATARCTLSAVKKAIRVPRLGAPRVKIVRGRTVYATGRAAHPGARHFRLVIKLLRPLTSGRYTLVIRRARAHGAVTRMVIIIGRQQTRARRPHRPKPARFTG